MIAPKGPTGKRGSQASVFGLCITTRGHGGCGGGPGNRAGFANQVAGMEDAAAGQGTGQVSEEEGEMEDEENRPRGASDAVSEESAEGGEPGQPDGAGAGGH